MEEVFREKDKGVSAIVGTILIVAITVVLAATVYGVLTGFGGMIGATAPTASMSVSQSGGSYIVSFTSSPSKNVSLSDVQVKVVNSTGTWVASISTGSVGPTANAYTITVSGSTTYLTINTVITLTPVGSVSGALTQIIIQDTNPSGQISSWSS